MRLMCAVWAAALVLAACAGPVPAALPAAPFCTRTLGQAECWADPQSLPDHPRPLADTPQGAAVAESLRARLGF